MADTIKKYPGFPGEKEIYEVNIGGTTIFRGEDFFTELGVTRMATKVQIIKAYRNLSLTSHPDKVSGADRERWNHIEKAYNFLISRVGNVNDYRDNFLKERWWTKKVNENDNDTSEYGKEMASWLTRKLRGKNIPKNDPYLSEGLKDFFNRLFNNGGKTIGEINSYVQRFLEIRSSIMLVAEVKRKEEKLTAVQVPLNVVIRKFEGLQSKDEIKNKFDKLIKWCEETADKTPGIWSKFKIRRAIKKELIGLVGWGDLPEGERAGFLAKADLFSEAGIYDDGTSKESRDEFIKKVKTRIAKTAGDTAEKAEIRNKQQTYLGQLRAKGGWNLLDAEEKKYLEDKITALNDKASQDILSAKALEYAQWFLRAAWVRTTYKDSLWNKLETLASLEKEDVTEDDGHGGRKKVGERYKEAKTFMQEPRPLMLDSDNLLKFKLFFYLIKDWGKDWNLIKVRLASSYSKTSYTHPYQSDIDDAIAEIRDEFDKDPKISAFELDPQYQNYPIKLKSFTLPTDIFGFKNQVIANIQVKRAAKSGDRSDPSARYKGDAIGAIDSALLLEPEVKLEELEAGNRNFAAQINGVYSKNSNAKDQIDAIKSRVLANIEKVRKAKQQEQNENETTRLEKLRTKAINLIHQELKRKPSLSESDISNRNWESEIKKASSESKIIEIRDNILAEIKNKQASLKEELEVKELIEKGKKATLFAELSEIISKLGNYSSTKAYQDHQNEIDQLENRLKSLDSSKYTEQTKKDLDNQLKNEGLLEKDLDEDTKKAKARAEQTGNPADKKIATQKISQNGAKNNLKKLLSKAVSVLANPKASQIEKEQLAAEIQQFIGKDDFKKTAYQKEKDRVDSLLAQLRGQSSQNQPTSPKPKWPKVLGIGALVIIPLSLVGLVVFRYYRIKRQRQRRD